MPVREWEIWEAYGEIYPLGSERADFHAAQICAATFAAQGQEAKPLDFLPDWGEIRKEQRRRREQARTDKEKKRLAKLQAERAALALAAKKVDRKRIAE